MDVELFLQIGAFFVITFSATLLYFHHRLNAQDKYLTTYIQAFAKYSDADFTPPKLTTTEVMKEDKKPQVYSPRHDPDTIMSGKVIDPFD